MRPDLEVGHTCSHFFDDSDPFVSQYSPGGNSRHVPFQNVESVPQIVVAVTRTMASVAACISGFGLASKARLPEPRYVSARISDPAFSFSLRSLGAPPSLSQSRNASASDFPCIG